MSDYSQYTDEKLMPMFENGDKEAFNEIVNRYGYKKFTDEQAIFMFQDGDERAYNEITHRYKDKLLNFISS